MKIKKPFALTLTLILLTSMMGVLPAAADSTALIDGATAAGLCSTSYPDGPFGPDQLSPCQWDMGVINSDAAHDHATGAGVRVGVIDSGVDFTHPDLAGGIDVAKSCSFIFDDTPTADPQEVANGDCTNKAAVQDLNGHGTHVATTIAA
ncbi:MAG TPA: S8 family serine peptidase, partial [Anaerolineales bacterium]|nr:S8 family serine peptidase [Anaerolineales bacterium]